MVRFLLVSLLLLLVTAPDFLTTEYYVIDTIADGVIRLEPLSEAYLDFTSYEQGIRYIKLRNNQHLEEGQVVAASVVGNRILKITPDPVKTEQRRAEITAILNRIRTTCGGD